MKKLLLALLLDAAVRADVLLVVTKVDNSLTFIDPVTMKVTGKVPVGEGPHEVAASTDGRIAVVSNYGTGPKPGSSLSIIDVAAKKEKRRLQLPGLLRPHGLFAIGSKIYLTCEGSRAVARYDVASDSVDWIAGIGQETTHMVVVQTGEKKIYTTDISSDTVSSVDLSSAPVKFPLKHIPVGKGPEGIAISPDGKEVWAAQRGDGNIAVIDTATDKVARTIPAGKLPFRLQFTPDNKRVIVTDAVARELLVYDAATKEIVAHIPMEEDPVGLVLSADGKKVFISHTGAAKVAAVDLETMKVLGAATTAEQPDGLAYAVGR
ncbi:MAG: YncE family protein [Acidobacteria bacterium]|nr:YncE family protein [Acidobacteriota bacterium]